MKQAFWCEWKVSFSKKKKKKKKKKTPSTQDKITWVEIFLRGRKEFEVFDVSIAEQKKKKKMVQLVWEKQKQNRERKVMKFFPHAFSYPFPFAYSFHFIFKTSPLQLILTNPFFPTKPKGEKRGRMKKKKHILF